MENLGSSKGYFLRLYDRPDRYLLSRQWGEEEKKGVA